MSKTEPLVSVVTTVYNCEKHIRESVESILGQTFSDFEFIIINDGSTDSTFDIVREYNDDRIVLIDNDDNKKIPTRRNEGIQIARAKYIAIHDGDDISMAYRLDKQYGLISKRQDLFCVGGHAVKIDDDGNVTGSMTYPPSRPVHVNTSLRRSKNPMIDPTTMFVRDIFIKLGMYSLDEEIYTVPDFDLWARAVSYGYKMLNIQHPLIRYRVNPNGMTQLHSDEMKKAHMEVWRRFMTGKYGNN